MSVGAEAVERAPPGGPPGMDVSTGLMPMLSVLLVTLALAMMVFGRRCLKSRAGSAPRKGYANVNDGWDEVDTMEDEFSATEEEETRGLVAPAARRQGPGGAPRPEVLGQSGPGRPQPQPHLRREPPEPAQAGARTTFAQETDFLDDLDFS